MPNVTGNGEYYNRGEEQSSTSNYIQVDTQKGDALANTPDTKVLMPKLKTDMSIVSKFSILEFLGFKIPIPDIQQKKIEEPKPTGDKAKYGQIVVRENKAGFVEIRDETPGNVRKIDQHPTGTYDAMLDNGDRVDKTTHKKITMVDDNWEIVVFKDQIEVISGDNKVTIKRDRFTKITNDDNLEIGNNQTEKIGNNRVVDVGNDDSLKTGNNLGVMVGNDKKEKVGNSSKMEVANTYTTQVGASSTHTVGGTFNLSVSGPCTITSSSMINIIAPKVNISS